MEKIGNQRFVVVYFNADTHMGLFPNNTFFLDAHSALRPSHRRQMKVNCSSPCHYVQSNAMQARDLLLRLLHQISLPVSEQVEMGRLNGHTDAGSMELRREQPGHNISSNLGMHLHNCAVVRAEHGTDMCLRRGVEYTGWPKTWSAALQALYAVHPNPLLRAWIISLRLSEPDIYGRVDYCERLGNLNVYFSGGKAPVPPQHVLDYDAEH